MSPVDDDLVPRAFGSWHEYWSVRHDKGLWTPHFRRALNLAGVASAEIVMLRPSQYPTARSDDLVVTVYPDASVAGNTFALELEAHALVADQGLPIPGVVAHGEFPHSVGQPVWHWLVESAATGQPWNQLRSRLDPWQMNRAAEDTGAALGRLHAVPHESGAMLGPQWERFTRLIKDEAENLGTGHDDRLRCFPERFRPSLKTLAEVTYAAVDTTAASSLLHGDVHGDNIFLDPESGRLAAIIDLNEMYAGHPWYDLADACFRLLHGAPPFTSDLLCGYGIDTPTAEHVAVRLVGWGLLHDFDGLTGTVEARGIPSELSNIGELASHLTGLTSAVGSSPDLAP